MKRNSMAAVLLALLPWTVLAAGRADDGAACQRMFAAIEKAGAAITQKQVDELLALIDSRCLAGAESHEWANELLFSVLLARPQEFIAAFSRTPSVAQGKIIRELESPVHDGIDLRAVFRSASSARGDRRARQRILDALEAAAQKTGFRLE